MKSFDIPIIYRTPLITAIKGYRKQQDKLKKDFSPTLLQLGRLNIYLARHFGFCYGVENAIEIAYRTLEENPGRNIYLLSEMIHNPQVNADLQDRGIRFLQDTLGNPLIPLASLNKDDIVIIPAFGATDDYGWFATENKIHIHDLHATILHLMGLDHEKLTYRYSGREYRLTDVSGRVVDSVLA